MLVTKRIIIAGDSWAAGEWNTDATVAHRGLQKFLTDDGHNVVNISYPGGSNLQAVERLNNYIQLNDSLLETIVFFFITEFFREIFYYPEKTSNVCNRVTVLEEIKKGYTKLRDQWVIRPYYRLQKLAQEANIQVYILGGCSDTVRYEDFTEDFPNLTIACQSVTNLIVNDDPMIHTPVFCEYINGHIDPFLKLIIPDEQLLQDMDLGHQRLNVFKNNKKWFWPDGIHPNRLGCIKLYDFLKDTMKGRQNNEII